ncbi:hypothetical protein LY632_06305 [Erythrobacter sp. SDW2]|uniref:hypothetical protein n=1 Tax=Erythrobacter sp. SDW2 TaxID=2907154 RepID=UPI001F207CA6|nr:hypothetical protein [Erythrobacter sp. SDW2]UIP08005.1 hypothetical protein LY632_06305 [Erythrobacter sp. SDW2]
MRLFPVLVLAAMIAGCGDQSNSGESSTRIATPRDKVETMLGQGPNGVDCYPSTWSKTQQFAQPLARVFDDPSLRFDMDAVQWKRSATAVSATARIDHSGYTYEFAVIGYGPDHPYAEQGYFCSMAAIPSNMSAPPLGGMTDAKTVADERFEPF